MTEKLAKIISLCKCGVSVNINEHRTMYDSVEKFLGDVESAGGDGGLDITPADREIMVTTDTIIQIQAYPNTPVGFYVVFHHDLDTALTMMIDTLEAD